jgi:acetoacetate decarboxylase
MNYPPAPWHLQGYATQTLNLVDIDRVRQFVPPELDIVAILPGKTIGSIYISEYQSGSALTYNELIIAPALVRDRTKIGGWISHIYVDNPASVAGGREIWGLQKELAEFTRIVGEASRNENRQIAVKQQDKILCSLSYRPNLLSELKITPKIAVPCFGNLNGNLLYFNNDFQGKVSFVDSTLEIPESSPFASLNLADPFLTIDLQDLKLVAGSPESTRTSLAIV